MGKPRPCLEPSEATVDRHELISRASAYEASGDDWAVQYLIDMGLGDLAFGTCALVGATDA